MISTELFSDSDTDVSADSDYNSGISDPSSPFLVATTLMPKKSTALFNNVVLPPGYHLEFTSIQPSFTEPAPVVSSNGETVLHFSKTIASKSSTFKHRLIKWSLPPPPVRPAILPGWSPTP